MKLIVRRGSAGLASDKALRAMFEDRKSIFVDLLKWNVPVLDGRFEVDQFDDEHATYIVVANAGGDHLGSARLLPTTRPHLLDSLFPELCATPPPTGRHVSEITRFCLSRRHSAHCRRTARNLLVSGLVAHALASGIRTYTGVAELRWLQQILAFGWECRPLGLPSPMECGTLGALRIEIARDTPELLAANGIWDHRAEPAGPVRKAA